MFLLRCLMLFIDTRADITSLCLPLNVLVTLSAVPRMPMDTPRMSSIQDRSLSLTWTPARIPAYARKTPILYSVEKKEPTDLDWVPLASRIPDTLYTVRNIEPKQDYLFRIRAENEYGISEATLPAALTRSKSELLCLLSCVL